MTLHIPTFRFAHGTIDSTCPDPIPWQKIAHGAMEAKGNGAGFTASHTSRGHRQERHGYILMLRKGGSVPFIQPVQKGSLHATKEEMQGCFDRLADLPGASTTQE